VTQRHIEIIRLKDNEIYTPNADEEAQVLGGAIVYVTGTITYLYLQDKQNRSLVSFIRLRASATSGTYTLNPLDINTACFIGELTSDTRGVWFGQNVELKFQAAATATATVIVEIRKVDPTTGIKTTEPTKTTPAIPPRVGYWQ